MVDITVPVPDSRTAEFYQFFGLWLAGSLSIAEEPQSSSKASGDIAAQPLERKPWTGSEDDLEDAMWLWRKYSRPARRLFSLMIDDPGAEYEAGQIAEAVGIKYGSRGVAGTLAWPGRYGWKRNRGLPTEWREEGGVSYYWMSPEVAETFKAARARVEGGDS